MKTQAKIPTQEKKEKITVLRSSPKVKSSIGLLAALIFLLKGSWG